MRTSWILLASLLAGCIQTETEPIQGAPFDQDTWLNSGALTWDDLDGQVVLVDFWTYSCVNCIRTFPHLTTWYDTYAPHGFTVIGVHSPEFEFEKDLANVEDAIQRHAIHYPVVLDNDFTIWRDWEQRFWPTHYLFGRDGSLVDKHIGEGGYFETEQQIRELLGGDLPAPVETEGQETRSPGQTRELYVGPQRQQDAIGNPEGYQPGDVVDYTLPDELRADVVYLEGTWENAGEAMIAQGQGKVTLSFRAGAANFVADGEGCVAIALDGAPPGELAGADVDECITIDGPRSYDFYAGPHGRHTVEFIVPDGFALYTFAFSQFPMNQ